MVNDAVQYLLVMLAKLGFARALAKESSGIKVKLTMRDHNVASSDPLCRLAVRAERKSKQNNTTGQLGHNPRIIEVRMFWSR